MPSKKQNADASRVVLTIGHSTHSIDDFIHLLQAHAVSGVADVRTIPRSRRNPQFNSDALAQSLQAAGIHYTHLPALGGLRHPSPHSINLGWRNTSFRGYADYMQTEQFESALADLAQRAGHDRLALMCAEAVPWRCHRSLIADALLARQFQVEHILSPKNRQPHRLTPFAVIQGARVTYPSERSSHQPELPG